MRMLSVAEDARAQVKMLLAAAVLAVALSMVPYAQAILYPFRLFVTFIHEGGHALAALATGGAVDSLVVNPDGSGMVLARTPFGPSGLLVSSAGYLGATGYGVLLLALIRRRVAARAILLATSAFVLFMTVRFGYASAFTMLSGIGLAASIGAAAKYAQAPIANFLLSFVAVQCVLNALFDLRTLFDLSTPFAAHAHTDAGNMAASTGIPAVVWAALWITISLAALWGAVKLYLAAPNPTP